MIKSLVPALALIVAACGASQAQIEPQTSGENAPVPTVNVPQNELTLERLYASPSLSGASPRSVKYSPDGKRVTFLKAREDEASRYDLWQFDVATGEPSMLVDSKLLEPEEVELSEEEKALRERKRIAGSKGIVSYDWGTSDTILVPIGGDLHLVTLGADRPTTRQLTQTDAFEYDAKVSPGGKYVSFVRDGAIYAIDLASGKEERLTPMAEPDKAIAYGVAEFVAQEEMSRYTGYWWSPGSNYIAYTKVDESTVDIVPRFDIAAEDVTVIEQRYPRAGRPNAVVDLFVRDMASGNTVPVEWRLEDWGPPTDQYLARINWQGDKLIVQSVNRDQTELRFADWDNTDGQKTKLGASPIIKTRHIEAAGEAHDTWINLSSDFKALSGGRFLTTYERPHPATHMKAWNEDRTETRMWMEPGEAFRHIWMHQGGDKPDLKITHGDWAVSEIVGKDDDGNVYFTGFADTPLEKHLYVVNYELFAEQNVRADNSATDTDPNAPQERVFTYASSAQPFKGLPMELRPKRITEAGKSWAVKMAPDGQSFVGTSSSPNHPAQAGLYKADGTFLTWVEENALEAGHPYAPYLADHTMPEYGTLTAEDGQTLYYSIQKPPAFDPSKTYPALVEVYGGPHAQLVTRNWERLSDQYYSRQGYIVFRLDNRGAANRGRKFEDPIYRQTGGPEVRDQLVGVEWLKSQPFVDADRIGIQGWSYGGYMALMTILQAPEGTFAAAVSGAPVTDWSLYDTFYTERYMDTPQDNAEGYDRSSVFYHLDKLETELPALMLIHGMADDNVTFDNSTRLYAELQKKGLPFEMMTYPGQRHGIRGEDLQVHLMRTRMAFLDRNLKADAE